MSLLEPWDYDGETLCPCCGSGFKTGRQYKICTDPLVTHRESCERYVYSDGDLCGECEMTEIWEDASQNHE